MRKHVGIFALWYVVFSTAAVLLAYFLEFGGTSTGIGALVAASMIAGAAFGKENHRAPTPEEKSAFAWGVLAVSALLTLATVPVVFAVGLSEEEAKTLLQGASSAMFWGIMIAAVLVLGAVYFWLSRWCFGWFAGKQVR